MDTKKSPLLQAAITCEATLNVINDIITRFDCILTKDSQGRLPITVAEELLWFDHDYDEVKQIIGAICQATATAQQRASIYVADEYGLEWDTSVIEITQSSAEEVVNGHDSLTGLRPFMLVEMVELIGLDSIYGLVRMAPEVLSYVSSCTSRKRKRGVE